MEVVLLDVLDRGVAVVAHGCDWNSSFQCKGDPGMAERVPGQRFPAGHIDLSAVVAVVLCAGRGTKSMGVQILWPEKFLENGSLTVLSLRNIFHRY